MTNENKINELKEWFLNDFNGNEVDFKEFLEYCHFRGMLNDNEALLDKILFTKSNANALYKEYISPIKRVSKLLKLKYKDLSELTGYKETAFRSAVNKGEVSEPMRAALFLLLEINKLQKQLSEKDKKIENLKRVLADTLTTNIK